MKHLHMTTTRVLLFFVCAAPLAAVQPAAAQRLSAQQAAKNAVEQYFQPGYRALMTEARDAEKRMDALCASPDAKHLAAAREGFGALVAAWSRIEMVRFGPALRDNQLERILFWPDRRGIGLRQVQALLAEKDESATRPDTLYAKSVAVQGLTALEFVLFGTDADNLTGSPKSFRCRYGAAIAGNIGNIAGNLHKQWTAADGIAAQLTHPGPDNRLYRNDAEVLSQIVGTLAYGFEAIRDTRLLPMMGKDAAHARPKAALFWRSGQTMPAIAANFAGVKKLYDTSHIGDTLRDDPDELARSIHTEFGNAATMLPTVTPDVARAVTEKSERGKIEAVYLFTRSLQGLIGQELAAVLGLSVGFSSSDGD
jgi:predicted lipoprotein